MHAYKHNYGHGHWGGGSMSWGLGVAGEWSMGEKVDICNTLNKQKKVNEHSEDMCVVGRGVTDINQIINVPF